VPADGRADFDFIFGRWRVRNRKLVDVADPACEEWTEFDATAAAEPILGGLGHVDRMWTDTFEGFNRAGTGHILAVIGVGGPEAARPAGVRPR
jgi:hypothetical protein